MLIGSGGAKTCALFDIDTLFGVDPKDQKVSEKLERRREIMSMRSNHEIRKCCRCDGRQAHSR